MTQMLKNEWISDKIGMKIGDKILGTELKTVCQEFMKNRKNSIGDGSDSRMENRHEQRENRRDRAVDRADDRKKRIDKKILNLT